MKKVGLFVLAFLCAGSAYGAQTQAPAPPENDAEAVSTALTILASAANGALQEIEVAETPQAKHHARRRLLVAWAGLLPLQQRLLKKQIVESKPEERQELINQFHLSAQQLQQVADKLQQDRIDNPDQQELNGLIDQTNFRIEGLMLAIDALQQLGAEIAITEGDKSRYMPVFGSVEAY